MAEVFLGSEALARGALTRGQLRWNYRRIHRDVYIPRDAARSLRDNIRAAWLWSDRRGVIAGRAAAALHGAKWVDDFTPIELVGPLNHPPPGIIVRRERIADDDIVELAGLPVTNLARTAFDLGRHLPRDIAVANLDALSNATGIVTDDVADVVGRHRGARGVRQCQVALSLMDGGAQSPKETWLRLVLIDGGLPRPVTQIRVTDGRRVAFIDMGYEEPKVGVEYDGEQHRTDRPQYVDDIKRSEMVYERGWHVIKVVKEDRPYMIVQRVGDALERRSGRSGSPRLP
ncbi:hypothetical protein BST27_17575 [Mycobacterium intermedium]|uniref:DUF559 domain-containing protein n=1 Tax=Mycobacterium intermedium TaxID=28445 RepID=A0A1E3SHG2_MYCIE|nr:hypothetical protein [Mycobacterium intermedium]MCV6963266.1 hypothetical protein [Mycobacterium intermedium]ODR01569.1 hypothetical protein BHQ20_08310 [Mycobacterium intermedium]OPE47465.1 hypothetical protein BV508_22055 [Mycobacterium intermedium]ORB01247.1 hypothetical protein BST27_17575 [Mycobacterium intermedium]